MPVYPPRSVRVACAVCLLIAAGPALAEEELLEHWIQGRELEMTQNLTADIDDAAFESVTRYFEQQLTHVDSLGDRGAAPPAVAAAALDPATGDAAAAPQRSRTECRADAAGSFSCVVTPAR